MKEEELPRIKDVKGGEEDMALHAVIRQTARETDDWTRYI